MKTHVFGCSLSEQIAWPNNFVVHALGAGDNTTMCRRYQDAFLNKLSPNDNILWEVTYPNRLGFRLSPEHHFYQTYKHDKTFRFHKSEPNIIDNQHHIDYVAFNKDWYETNYYVANINQELQNLLFHLIIANKNNNLLVWFADYNMMDTETFNKFIVVLKNNNIKYIEPETSIMTWVKNKNYPLADDGMHPQDDAYIEYRDTILLPNVK